MARQVAEVAVAMGGGIDLLTCPPSVYDAVRAVLTERAEAEQRQHDQQQLKEKLRRAVGRG